MQPKPSDSKFTLDTELKNRLFSAKKLILFIIFVPLVFAAIIIISLFFEPSTKPEGVNLTNQSDKSVTVTWTTKKPTKGIILISENGKFPLSPIVADLIYKDDDEKGTPTVGRYLTHSVTIGKLKPDTTYQYRIYQGLRYVYEGEFKTTTSLSDISTPNPVYGQILSAEDKPVAGALVFLRVASSINSHSSVLSTLTNINGRWSIDLSSLRSSDLSGPFTPSDKSTYEVIVESVNKGKFKSATTSAYLKPYPTILLKAKR